MQTVKHKIFGSGEVKEQIGACGNCTVMTHSSAIVHLLTHNTKQGGHPSVHLVGKSYNEKLN